MSTDIETPDPARQRLTESELAHVAQRFGVTLTEVTEDSPSRGSIEVTNIAEGSLLEGLLTRPWLEGKIGGEKNEIFLIWLDPAKGDWRSWHVGVAMEASYRYVVAMEESPMRAVPIDTRPERNIYMFFQTRDGISSKLYLGHPTAGGTFGDDARLWPLSARDSYLRALNASVTPAMEERTPPVPERTQTSDLLFRMYEIARCNDPGQQVLTVVAAHLEALGYDLTGC